MTSSAMIGKRVLAGLGAFTFALAVMSSPVCAEDGPETNAAVAGAGPTTSPGVPGTAGEPAAQTDGRNWFGHGLPWSRWSTMSGDWAKVRTNLKTRGIAFEINHTADASGLPGGAIGSPWSARALTMIGLDVDLGKTVGLRGGRMLVQYERKGGGNGAESAGDAQGFSNIDADDFSRIGEFWYEQQLTGKVRFKVGRIDANTEFAFVENGADFINSSMGFSPTIFVLPTYPDPKFGIVAQVQPRQAMYASLGIFNGGPAVGGPDFSALFAIGELGLQWDARGGGRIGLGYWRSSGRSFLGEDPGAAFATSGHFVVVDQTLWDDEATDRHRSVAAFLQAGLADPRVSPVSRHLGAGIVARGLLPGRPDDAFGLGVTTIELGEAAAPDELRAGEFNADAFYKFAVSPWIALKPDFQIIWRPGGDPTRRAVVASTLRIEVTF